MSLTTFTKQDIQIFGYVRLSRDEDKANYDSIVTQKKIIKRYVSENLDLSALDQDLYEDDNISGYKFNRPEFNRMIKDINTAIEGGKNVILVSKDLSRIGRHNALTLLFLEDMSKIGVRVILIGENYDSSKDDDSILGIKTWYNERYVKDTSKKIKAHIKEKMESGEYISAVPYGYKRDSLKPEKIIIDEEVDWVVRKIFDMYLQGAGYRKICIYLTENRVPTPSMILKRRKEEKGQLYKKYVTEKWSQKMIQRIIRNDFYIGTLRQGRYQTKVIHGKPERVDSSNQYIFKHNHEAIISIEDFNLAQNLAEKRLTHNYRGGGNKNRNLFSGFLVCPDCGHGMVALNKEGKNKSYICGTYNRLGRTGCTTHYILDKTLVLALKAHLKILRSKLSDSLQEFDSLINIKNNDQEKYKGTMVRLEKELKNLTDELKVTFAQKIKDITKDPESEEIITETYNEIVKEKQQQIASHKKRIEEMSTIREKSSEFKENVKTALQVFDDLIAKEKPDRKDLEILIDKIVVSKDGEPTIYLKANIEQLFYAGDDGGFDPDKGNKATITYMAGAVKKSFISSVAIKNQYVETEIMKFENNEPFSSEVPSCTPKQGPTVYKGLELP